ETESPDLDQNDGDPLTEVAQMLGFNNGQPGNRGGCGSCEERFEHGEALFPCRQGQRQEKGAHGNKAEKAAGEQGGRTGAQVAATPDAVIDVLSSSGLLRTHVGQARRGAMARRLSSVPNMTATSLA